MPQLRLIARGPDGGHEGEVFACAFSPDGRFVLSGGWDAHLRLWEATTGAHLTALQAAPKALSACAFTPDGRQWVSGSLEGMLGVWDSVTHKQVTAVLAHTRPISAIQYAPDGQTLATASWDRSLVVWTGLRERESRPLLGHEDIVGGCRFTPDGAQLLSWSHDGTVRLWDVGSGRSLCKLRGHTDRVTAAAVSPDGAWVVSGARDRVLKLWNLSGEVEERSVALGAEVRACFFLLDGQTLLTVDAAGRLVLLSVPELRRLDELVTRVAVQCADLWPLGNMLALGAEDGRVHFAAVDGMDEAALLVTATQTTRQTQSRLLRLLGRPRVTHAYACTCPSCQHQFELTGGVLGQEAACPRCGRPLRLSRVPRLKQQT